MFKKLRIKYLERMAFNNYISQNFQKAEAYFKKILTLEPKRLGIRHNLGAIALAQKQFAKAEGLFLEEVAQFGENYPRLRLLADLYYLWGKKEKALDTYKQCNIQGPPDSDKRLIKARIAVCKDAQRFTRVAEALKFYDEGNRLMEEKKWDEAEDQFVQAVKLDETNISAWNNLGTIRLNHFKNYQGAAEAFRRALSLQKIGWIESNLKNAERLQSQ